MVADACIRYRSGNNCIQFVQHPQGMWILHSRIIVAGAVIGSRHYQISSHHSLEHFHDCYCLYFDSEMIFVIHVMLWVLILWREVAWLLIRKQCCRWPASLLWERLFEARHNQDRWKKIESSDMMFYESCTRHKKDLFCKLQCIFVLPQPATTTTTITTCEVKPNNNGVIGPDACADGTKSTSTNITCTPQGHFILHKPSLVWIL